MNDVVERATAFLADPESDLVHADRVVEGLVVELVCARARIADLEREAAWHRDR